MQPEVSAGLSRSGEIRKQQQASRGEMTVSWWAATAIVVHVVFVIVVAAIWIALDKET